MASIGFLLTFHIYRTSRPSEKYKTGKIRRNSYMRTGGLNDLHLWFNRMANIVVGEQFMNLLANHIKVVIFTAKYIIMSNFLKKKWMPMFFSFLCIFFQIKILTTRFQLKITHN